MRFFATPTLEADTVTLEGLHCLLEKLLATRGHSRNIVLFPLDRSIDVLEDFLHGVGDFRTNTVTGDKSNLGLDS